MEPAVKRAKMTNPKFKQNKKKYFHAKRQVLQPGQRGFFATCNINEKACVRECYNLLNHYADLLYGPENPENEPKKKQDDEKKEGNDAEKPTEGAAAAADDDDDDDLEAAAAKCREQFSQRKVRFQNMDTGTTNCVFIRTLLDDPVELGKYIINDIQTTGKAQSRFVLRLVPIEAVCRANMPDIISAAGTLFDKHFLKEPTSYGIIFNHRYNQQIKRDEVIKQLAELVNSKNLGNKVDLKQAKKSIIVEVLRGFCLLSVIDNYLESKKYNLAELVNPSEKKSNDGGDSKSEKSLDEDNKNKASGESEDGEEKEKDGEEKSEKPLEDSKDKKNGDGGDSKSEKDSQEKEKSEKPSGDSKDKQTNEDGDSKPEKDSQEKEKPSEGAKAK